MSHHLVFQPYGVQAAAEDGKTVLQTAREAGVSITASCGGGKSCGKCRVKLTEGCFEKHQIASSASHLSPVTDEERALLTKAELSQGYRLACAAEVKGDAVIEVPEESRLQAQVILEAGISRDVPLKSAVRLYALELEPATLTDCRDDLTRVRDALGGYAELDPDLQIDLETLRALPSVIRSGDWKLTVYILYGKKIIGLAPGKIQRCYGAAADIGTTTVVVYLCDLNTGALLRTGSFINPQVPYGDDVVSRISYCMDNPKGLETLHHLLIDALNAALSDLAQAEGLSSRDICEAVFVCNTVMACLTLGVSPQALGVAPFISPVSEPLDIPARALGVCIMDGGNIHFLPSEAGFVGADNVAVLIAEEPHRQDKLKLIIDIGTNSEICLGNKDGLYVTSCATGPALEGAHIKCGMRAAAGAVEAVTIHPVTLEPTLKIIGAESGFLTPAGICGSGILDAVAQMALTGILEPDGRFSSQAVSPRIRTRTGGKKEYVLYFADAGGRDVVVTAADVRAVQLAKGALYAGAKTLMAYRGISSVDEVVLAGAFGSHISPENALALGLFPDCSCKSITVSGNAAGLGARLALCNTDLRQQARRIAREVVFVETAAEESFSSSFAKAMTIPHRCDTFTRNKPLAYPCPGLHAASGKAPSAAYLFEDPASVLELSAAALRNMLRAIIAQNARAPLPEGLTELPGPFALLGHLVSPVILYACAKKRRQALDEALARVTEALTELAIEALDGGVKIISYADPAGEMEHVGKAFYRDFSGKYKRIFFAHMEPLLDDALIHVCGKTSVSMEKAGFMLARPYRMNADKDYIDVLFEEAARRRVRFVGHACINMQRKSEPILYRLELCWAEPPADRASRTSF